LARRVWPTPSFRALDAALNSTRRAAIEMDDGRGLPASSEHRALAMARPDSFPVLPASSALGACRVTPALALRLAPAWTQQLLSYGSQSYPLDLRPTLGRPPPIWLTNPGDHPPELPLPRGDEATNAPACFPAPRQERHEREAEMLDERQITLAIQALRLRLEAAKETGQSPALIRALGETLAEFEAGRLPHRYPSRRRDEQHD
jgi:hypothetical protein